MEERYYVVSVTTTSGGTEQRSAVTPYTDLEIAQRKFFEPLGSIGAGPIKICVILFDKYLNVIKHEAWEHVEPEPEEEVNEE